MTTLCQGQKERYVCPSRKRCRLFLEWEKVPTIARSQVSSVLLWRQIGEETCEWLWARLLPMLRMLRILGEVVLSIVPKRHASQNGDNLSRSMLRREYQMA